MWNVGYFITHLKLIAKLLIVPNESGKAYCTGFVLNSIVVDWIGMAFTQGCHRHEPKNKDSGRQPFHPVDHARPSKVSAGHHHSSGPKT